MATQSGNRLACPVDVGGDKEGPTVATKTVKGASGLQLQMVRWCDHKRFHPRAGTVEWHWIEGEPTMEGHTRGRPTGCMALYGRHE